YSLGGTLYFLLTGRPPFPTGTAIEKLYKHCEEAPEPVEKLRPDVPAGVAALVARLLAKRPADRFPTPPQPAAAPKPAAQAGPPQTAGGPVPAATTGRMPTVLFILPQDGLYYPDFGPARDWLVQKGVRVVAASSSRAPCRLLPGTRGEPVTPDLALSENPSP